MSTHTIRHHALIRNAAIAAGFVLVSAVSAVSAQAGQVNPRSFQAFGYDVQIGQEDHAHWRKADGAEIIGGFAGADDEVNADTGEVRHR